jgi:hypothetical protein
LNWIAAAACFGLSLSAEVRVQHPPRYTVKDLGQCASGYGISSHGVVAGAVDQCGAPANAFLWRCGLFINLDTLGGLNSGASVVNAKGEVALSSETSKMDPYGENFCRTDTGQQCVAAVWKGWCIASSDVPKVSRRSAESYLLRRYIPAFQGHARHCIVTRTNNARRSEVGAAGLILTA